MVSRQRVNLDDYLAEPMIAFRLGTANLSQRRREYTYGSLAISFLPMYSQIMIHRTPSES
jgi:hypothetical protein